MIGCRSEGGIAWSARVSLSSRFSGNLRLIMLDLWTLTKTLALLIIERKVSRVENPELSEVLSVKPVGWIRI